MKILLADDDDITRQRLAHLLKKWGYDVIQASNGTDSWRVLEAEDAPHLAIIDWMMPGMDGIELCRRLRAEKRQRYVYVLLLTSNRGHGDVIAGLAAGADDYIMKPCDPAELHLRLCTGKRIIELQDALRAQAARDPLTHTWNRRGIFDLLARQLKRAEEQRGSTALVMTDIDHFKRINDVHGHLAGDAALVEVAGRLMRAVRPCDAVGRYGGEEFLIIAPGCGPADALLFGERLRAAVAAKPVDHEGASISVTASFGVVVSTGGATPESLIEAADAALYRAKDGGRNRVEIAGEVAADTCMPLLAMVERR